MRIDRARTSVGPVQGDDALDAVDAEPHGLAHEHELCPECHGLLVSARGELGPLDTPRESEIVSDQ